METGYCLFIDRRFGNGEDFTDLPFGDQTKLQTVAEAALRIPYVTAVRLHRKDGEMQGGHPRWEFPPYFERENSDVKESYTTEDKFRKDLRFHLGDNQLFDSLYENKEAWVSFLESLT